MIRGPRFWILMAMFQIVFGLAIFTVTRQYYIQDSDTATHQAPIESSTFTPPVIEDPNEVARQANEFFANKQYDSAADSYERLLALDPNDVNTYNNLGITLHYLGRSTEALSRLEEGVSVDPTYPRIWLTLGFVNSQLGNIGQALSAPTARVRNGGGGIDQRLAEYRGFPQLGGDVHGVLFLPRARVLLGFIARARREFGEEHSKL